MNDLFLREYRGGAASVSIARHAIVTFAQSSGFSDVVLDDIETSVGEALANAAEHGSGAEPWFTVRADVIDDSLVIEIKDGGGGFDSAGTIAGETSSRSLNRGFGITIMRQLMDRVEYFEGGTGVRLHVRRPVPSRLLARDRAHSEG